MQCAARRRRRRLHKSLLRLCHGTPYSDRRQNTTVWVRRRLLDEDARGVSVPPHLSQKELPGYYHASACPRRDDKAFLYSNSRCLLLLPMPLLGLDLQVQKRLLSNTLAAQVCSTMAPLPGDLQQRYGRIYELCPRPGLCPDRSCFLSPFRPLSRPFSYLFLCSCLLCPEYSEGHLYRLNLTLGLASPISYAYPTQVPCTSFQP